MARFYILYTHKDDVLLFSSFIFFPLSFVVFFLALFLGVSDEFSFGLRLRGEFACPRGLHPRLRVICDCRLIVSVIRLSSPPLPFPFIPSTFQPIFLLPFSLQLRRPLSIQPLPSSSFSRSFLLPLPYPPFFLIALPITVPPCLLLLPSYSSYPFVISLYLFSTCSHSYFPFPSTPPSHLSLST